MSKSASFGFTDAVATPKNLPIVDLSYATNFAVNQYQPDKVELVNITSPMDQLEYIRYQCQPVADVYKGTSIDPSAYSLSRKGIAVAAVVRDTLRVTDSADSTFVLDLPVKASLSLTLPQSTYLTGALVQQLLTRVVSAWFETGAVDSDRIMAMVRGSMKPAEL